FISGDIIPDKKDNTKVIDMDIIVLIPRFCLFEAPINIPKDTPNKLPKTINIRLYLISVKRSIFNTNFINNSKIPLDNKFSINATKTPENIKLPFLTGVILSLDPRLLKFPCASDTVSIPENTL